MDSIMTNYILIYKIADRPNALNFIRDLKGTYPDNRLEVRHDIPYFAFAAKNLPEVEENVVSIIKNVGVANTDYVALYYIKEEEPEKIKRLMILGPSDIAEQNMTNISSAEHENLLSDMFDIDFMKLRFSKQEK